jgi:hypothetical protein
MRLVGMVGRVGYSFSPLPKLSHILPDKLDLAVANLHRVTSAFLPVEASIHCNQCV